jgi:hypothetical protein
MQLKVYANCWRKYFINSRLAPLVLLAMLRWNTTAVAQIPSGSIAGKAMDALGASVSTTPTAQPSSAGIPRLVRDGDHVQFLVDGEPFIMLGAQSGNTSASNLEDVEVVFRALSAVHANTVEIPVSWSQVENEPGKFDFHLVDGIIEGARRHHMKLIFLWFGSSKNGLMGFTPDWIKRDSATYFRVRDAQGVAMYKISPFSEEALKADQRAFSALMRHIKEFDQHDQTVILMQVENEDCFYPEDRDYSEAANRAFDGQPPADLMSYLEKHRDAITPALQSAWKQAGYRMTGSWVEVFGDMAAEVFGAWSLSSYIEKIAEAGKAQYAIPYYVNVPLINSGQARAGDWPSGTANSQVFDIWKAVAKHIDIIAPDIYRLDFPQQAAFYNRPDNVLFVAETGIAPYYAPYAFTTLAGMNGIGYTPFGIDHGYEFKEGALTDDQAALEENYRVLRPLLPLIARNRYNGTLFPIVLDTYRHEALAIPLGDSLTAVVHFDEKFVAETQAHRSGGIIIKLAADKFIVAGEGFHVNFAELRGVTRDSEYLSIEEGTFDGEKWVTERVLNGDEENTTLLLRQPRILQVRLNRMSK